MTELTLFLTNLGKQNLIKDTDSTSYYYNVFTQGHMNVFFIGLFYWYRHSFKWLLHSSIHIGSKSCTTWLNSSLWCKSINFYTFQYFLQFLPQNSKWLYLDKVFRWKSNIWHKNDPNLDHSKGYEIGNRSFNST